MNAQNRCDIAIRGILFFFFFFFFVVVVVVFFGRGEEGALISKQYARLCR